MTSEQQSPDIGALDLLCTGPVCLEGPPVINDTGHHNVMLEEEWPEMLNHTRNFV